MGDHPPAARLAQDRQRNGVERRPDVVTDEDSWLLPAIARAATARPGVHGWTVEPGEFWCVVAPPEPPRRRAGRELHLSATLLSAPLVLARAADVLVRERCAFTFARGLAQLADLLSAHRDPADAGRFLTAYPDSDEQAQRLATELDRATDGLPGPAILTDQPVRPGSLVHRPAPVAAATGVPPVLIADRFLTGETVSRTYRGDVFLATDQRTGAEVILKQARAHVMSVLSGADARDVLRHEAAMLDLVGPLRLAPLPIALATHKENLYLAREFVPGVPLRVWVADRVTGAWAGRGAPPAEAIELAAQLVDLVVAVHAQDLVVRDLSPDNVIVGQDRQLRLVDLAHVVRTGTRARPVTRRGYCAPETGRARPEADLFSLGATIAYLASGLDIGQSADHETSVAGSPDGSASPNHPDGSAEESALPSYLSAVARSMPAVRLLAPLLHGLLRDDPYQRWSLRRAKEFLAADQPSADQPPAADPRGADGLPSPVVDRLVTEGLVQLRDQPGSLELVIAAARTIGVADRSSYVYEGQSVWARFDAARLLGEPARAAEIVAEAKQAPPDALTLLRLWNATGDRELKRLGIEAAAASGSGLALLYAGLAGDRPDLIESAGRAAEAPDADPALLIRLWVSTGDSQPKNRAKAKGAAIRRDRWYFGPAELAAGGHVLLDLAEFTGEPRYRDWAGELATVLAVRPPLDPAGVGFLLRLRHGGPARWPDEILADGRQLAA